MIMIIHRDVPPGQKLCGFGRGRAKGGASQRAGAAWGSHDHRAWDMGMGLTGKPQGPEEWAWYTVSPKKWGLDR